MSSHIEIPRVFAITAMFLKETFLLPRSIPLM